jgi:hypothetical protein
MQGRGVAAEMHGGMLFTSLNMTVGPDAKRIDYGICSDPSAAPDFSGWPFSTKQMRVAKGWPHTPVWKGVAKKERERERWGKRVRDS